jgi:hypothetical protein
VYSTEEEEVWDYEAEANDPPEEIYWEHEAAETPESPEDEEESCCG